MNRQIEVDGIPVTVVRKQIKSFNLYVKAPDGQVRLSVPLRTSDRAARAFVHAHLDWIARQQRAVRARHIPRRCESGESIPVFGVRCVLEVREAQSRRDCGVQREENRLTLTAPAHSTCEQREEILRRWQREQLREATGALLAHWALRMHVHVREWHIERMKTRWGSCNCGAQRIWLNLALAEQPPACVEYVVVHELCHLLEPSHSERFWRLMTQFLPDWPQRRASLNRKEQTET